MYFSKKSYPLNNIISKENFYTFDEIYKENYSSIKNYIFKMCNNQSISEEITQDVFIKFYKYKHKIKYEKIKAWLYKVAHNEAVNYFKKNNKINEHLNDSLQDTSNTPDRVIEENHKRKIIQAILIKLPPNQSTAILLKDMEGYSYDEISCIMGISYNAVKSLLYRARQNFIKYYKEVSNL